VLFYFNGFWKTLVILISSWIFYTIFDFEFTVVTIGAMLIALEINKK
tara:strand:+ start:800 stop:940 length:141 start_codon:yes stop_codon:yes gene_type:complete